MTVTDDLVLAGDGNLYVTGGLSVTTPSHLYGLVLGVGPTLAITANYGITPTYSSILYITDNGGQASGTVTLSATTSIVDGSTIGQLLLIMYVDTAGATMTIKDNANVQLPGNSDLALGLGDSVLVMWNGTDWFAIGAANN